MSTWLLYALSGVAVIAVGFAGTFTARASFVRRIVALNVMTSGLFLVFIGIARRGGGEAPDPVPQALVLTGVVVSVSATGLGLTLARRLADAGEPPPREKEP